jgi:hypothetical protein
MSARVTAAGLRRLASKVMVTTSITENLLPVAEKGAEADEQAAKLRFVRPVRADTSFTCSLYCLSNSETGSTTCCIITLESRNNS